MKKKHKSMNKNYKIIKKISEIKDDSMRKLTKFWSGLPEKEEKI
jgi:hypothetical protein